MQRNIFLDINEESPEYMTPTGRVKRRKSVIGTRYAGHNSMTGIMKGNRMLKGLGERHDSGVKITLLTLPADGYPKERIEKTKELLAELTELGVAVMEKPKIHEHFAVIDKKIVWYGSVNLLSNAKEEDNLMRVKSKEIAQELLEIGFTVSDR